MKTIFTNLKKISKDLKNNIRVYQIAVQDPRTPRPSRFLLKTAIYYTNFVYDLIPDFVPVIGKLDDIVILPFLVTAALQLIPQEVLEDARHRVQKQKMTRRVNLKNTLKAKTTKSPKRRTKK